VRSERAKSNRVPRVLFDATPLLTPSGKRGIGRLTYDVLHSLAAARASWERSIEIVAITSLSLTGRVELDDDLVRAAETCRARRDTLGASSHWARRIGLGVAAKHSGAALVHLPEMIGVPWSKSTRFSATCHDLICLADPEHYVGIQIAEPDRYVLQGPGLVVHRAGQLRRWTRAHRVICVSTKTRDDLVTLLGIDPARLDLVISGVDTRCWTPGDVSEGERRSKPYVLYVGDADYRKNIDGMFRTLKAIRRHHEIDLVWAGGLSPASRAEVERRAAEAGVSDSLVLAGFVPDDKLLSLYRGAVALLFLSRLEGFGLPAVEALAAGCPVVVAANSGTDEIVGEAGEIVSADDPEQAARAVLKLAQEPEARAASIARGLERAKLYDRLRMASGYVASFERSIA
jgi:glycosyltransferase involved in cell wall biosynthesis